MKVKHNDIITAQVGYKEVSTNDYKSLSRLQNGCIRKLRVHKDEHGVVYTTISTDPRIDNLRIPSCLVPEIRRNVTSGELA